MKILFICKRRQLNYSEWGEENAPSGLLNSAMFVSDMLNDLGVKSKVVQVIDNNDIDREVYNYKPTHVFIEAIWVVPEKFDILKSFHPSVKWIVRLHSEFPFLSNEGIAIDWLFKYRDKDIAIATNSSRIGSDLRRLLNKVYDRFDGRVMRQEVPILPNYYPVNLNYKEKKDRHPQILDVGCFGAIRPFKNQLIQAVAAIKFADITDKNLRFHINCDRVESGGNPVLSNIRALFSNVEHDLVEHPWMPQHKFLDVLRKMDVGMQVSFSETYSVISADMVNCNVPIVVSKEVSWTSSFSKADANDVNDIVSKMYTAVHYPVLAKVNKYLLNINSASSKRQWRKYIQKEVHSNGQ
jgi:hypothetical protein